MKTILIIPSNIHSHIIPTFGLAKILKEDFNIHYAVTNVQYKDIVEKNGYKSSICSQFNLYSNHESSYLSYLSKKINFKNILLSKFRNEVYRHRLNSLERIIENVKPSVVLLDIFISSDFIIIQKYKNIKFAFYNPMLSLQIEKHNLNKKIFNDSFKFNLKNLLAYLKSQAHIYMYYKLQLKIQMYANKVSNEYKIDRESYYTTYTNVKEIILAPEELEIPSKIKKEWQYYLGNCVDIDRYTTEKDENEILINNILKENKNKKIIYCSFGTYYRGSNKRLFLFVDKVISAVCHDPSVILIVSTKDKVIEALKIHRKIPKNIYLFEYVNQARILKNTDVFITHGGLGSIKESIANQVPMIVFPLDLQHDQKRNAERVEYYRLGLKGPFDEISTIKIKKKIKTLLKNQNYRKNIAKFNSKLLNKYSDSYIKSIIQSFGWYN